jgi:hypothetical protein
VRLQLTTIVVATIVAMGACTVARADEVEFRGNYYRDKNTRVIQPEVDVGQELPSGTTIGGHYLLDAITSASQAAGVIQDKPFTELRNEIGFRVGQRIGPTQHTVSYSYSSESDYWAHSLSVASTFDFFQKNSTLGLVTSYGSDVIALRQGPTVFTKLGGLQTFGQILTWTQVLHKYALGVLEYDLAVQGFGSKKGSVTGAADASTGYQGNAYRQVNVGGSPEREVVPFQRVREAVSAAVNVYLPTGSRVMPYIVLRPSYRWYWDDWGVKASTVELRTYVPVGPTELHVNGRYYTQTKASFASVVNDVPTYELGAARGLPCTTCYAGFSHADHLFYTSDPKLTAFDTVYLELGVSLKLDVIFGHLSHPIPRWLRAGLVSVTYGHYFNDRDPHLVYGDADLATLSLLFPL